MKLFKTFLVLALTSTFLVTSAIASENTIQKQRKDTPASAVQQFFYSFIKKDPALLKKRLTKETLAILKKGAEKKGMTLDEAIKAFVDSNPFPMRRTPVMQKQKLNGDKCTIEAYIEKKWQEIPLVKQDDIWRVDFMAIK